MIKILLCISIALFITCLIALWYVMKQVAKVMEEIDKMQ